MRKPLFLIVLLIGCGGGGGDDDGDDVVTPDASVTPPDAPQSDLTVQEAFDEVVRLQCQKAFDCQDSFPGQPADFEQAFGTSVDECIANLSTELNAAEYIASVEAGRIVFNPNDARTCLDAFEALTCEAFWGGADVDPTCDTTFVGQVPDGGECTMDDDCANDASFCDTTCMAG